MALNEHRAHNEVRRRLRARPGDGRPVGRPHRTRRLRLRERRADDDLDDRPLPTPGSATRSTTAVWGVTGYGTGGLSLTPDGAAALETGVSMATSAVGTRGELAGSRATGGLALAFKVDALWVARPEQTEGAAGQTERLRGRGDAVGRRPRGLAGLHRRRPAVADAERRGRPATARRRHRDRRRHGHRRRARHERGDRPVARRADAVARGAQADGLTDRGVSMSLGWDPTPSSPLGLTARVAPSRGGQALDGAEALLAHQMAYGMGPHPMYSAGGQVKRRGRLQGCRSAPASSGHRVGFRSSAYRATAREPDARRGREPPARHGQHRLEGRRAATRQGIRHDKTWPIRTRSSVNAFHEPGGPHRPVQMAQKLRVPTCPESQRARVAARTRALDQGLPGRSMRGMRPGAYDVVPHRTDHPVRASRQYRRNNPGTADVRPSARRTARPGRRPPAGTRGGKRRRCRRSP